MFLMVLEGQKTYGDGACVISCSGHVCLLGIGGTGGEVRFAKKW